MCVCVCVCVKVCVCVYASYLKGGVAVGVAYCKKAHDFSNGFTDLHKIVQILLMS